MTLILLGCSSKTQDPVSTSIAAKPLDQWQQMAAKTCDEHRSRAHSLSEPNSPAEAIAVYEELDRIAGEQIAALEALGAPEGRADDYDQLMALLVQQRALLPDLIAALEDDDMAAFEDLLSGSVASTERELNEVAEALGVRSCGA